MGKGKPKPYPPDQGTTADAQAAANQQGHVMPYGNVGYQGGMAGSGSVGGNPGNSLALLMQRLMGGQRGGPTQYGSPDAELAMARMLGLEGAEGGMSGSQAPMPPDPRMMGRGMAGGMPPPNPSMGGQMAGMQPTVMGGMRPPTPMSKPMMGGGMGLGGGMMAGGGDMGYKNAAMPTGQTQMMDPNEVDPRKLAMMRARGYGM